LCENVSEEAGQGHGSPDNNQRERGFKLMDHKVVQKIGKYDILSELGQGGMGVVYKARDSVIGRLVALKTVNAELVSDPQILLRFYREAQSAGTLQHPNIVTVFDLGEFEGQPYIAMEYVEGESLQSIIARKPTIPLAAKLRLVEQICSGLDHAHKNGIVHRDVKPGNILVKNDGTVKVVDFGIVRIESTTLTKTGTFMGTIQYASPEQLSEGHVDQRSDLWSVVCVLYEFIAYRKPFEGSNFGAIVGKVLTTEPEPLSHLCPEVPAELDNLIAKGLKKDVGERYQSLEELMVDLEPIGLNLQRSLIGDLLAEGRQLKEKGNLIGAQEKVRIILILDRTQTDAKRLNTEIRSELQRLSSLPRVRELVSEGEAAFKRGEFADAIRALAGALELNPNDTQARNLKERAAQEQERQRQLREALTAGQKALKQGDLTGAEMELQKVLALDKNNSQASTLLSEIRRDRFGREKSFGFKEALWKADSLVSEGKYQEAKAELAALQKEFPQEQEVQQKLQEVNNRLTEVTLPMFPGAGSASEQAQWREARLTEATQSLASNDFSRATLLLSNVKDRFPADSKVQALEQQLEQKKSGEAVQPIKPAVPLRVETAPPKRSAGMIFGGIALAVVLGVGSFLYYHRSRPAGVAPSASPQEIELEHDAKLLQDYGNRDAALSKWRDLAALKGPLQGEAQQAVAQITHQHDVENQETSLFSQGMDAQQAKKWDIAAAFYQKVADLNGPMKEQALQAISSVKELQAGADASTLEKEKYDHAVAALAQQDYAKSQILFQQVLDLKIPGSTLAAKAQTQLDTVKATQQSQKQFAAADKTQSSGDLKGALAEFQDIAAKPGTFQAQAQARVQQINQILTANQEKQQAEKALQDNLKKFHALESQKKYGDAAALLTAIGQTGGDSNQLKNELESAEQADLQSLTNQFNQAKNKKDTASLLQLKSQFQTLASASGVPASQARDYAENQIPAAITQINQANQPKPQPPPTPAPPVHAPVVLLLVSGPNRPWTRPVQKGMLVPEYTVEGGLKPLSLAMPVEQGAPSGSIVTLKINIDEDGSVSPDIVLLDQAGMGQAVMDAVKKWKFSPPMVKGKAVKTSVAVKVTF
jgi:TonB family protein